MRNLDLRSDIKKKKRRRKNQKNIYFFELLNYYLYLQRSKQFHLHNGCGEVKEYRCTPL